MAERYRPVSWIARTRMGSIAGPKERAGNGMRWRPGQKPPKKSSGCRFEVQRSRLKAKLFGKSKTARLRGFAKHDCRGLTRAFRGRGSTCSGGGGGEWQTTGLFEHNDTSQLDIVA